MVNTWVKFQKNRVTTRESRLNRKLFISEMSERRKFRIRDRILVQATIYHRLLIGRDGHCDQSEAYDIS